MTELLPRNFIPSSILDDFRAFYYGEVDKELMFNSFSNRDNSFIVVEYGFYD